MKEKKRRSLWGVLGRIAAFLLALVLALAAAILLLPLTEKVNRAAVPQSADWMAGLAEELPVSAVTIPGTHDSATRYVDLAFFSKCQALSVREQLEAGYRYLDIRLGTDGDGEELYLMHGFTFCRTGAMPWAEKLTLSEALRDCGAFLEAHPTETILFAVKQEHGELPVAAFESAVNAALTKELGAERLLLTDALPTVGECRGKLVLLRRYEDAAGLGPAAGIPLLWENQSGSEDVSLHAAREDNGSYTLWVQDRYEYGTEDKWTAFLAGMAAGASDAENVRLSFLSTKGTLAYGHPYSFARKLDPRLLSFSGNISGWIALDFASPELAERIWSVNFPEN